MLFTFGAKIVFVYGKVCFAAVSEGN